MIITKALVEQAIELARPSAELVLKTEGMTWGPKYVQGYVFAPGSYGSDFIFGEYLPGQDTFWHYARAKLEAVMRTGKSTDFLVTQAPWLLKDGEYLYAGGVTEGGISVAVSGAEAYVDEALAWMVLNYIVMLAKLEAGRRIADGRDDQMQI